MDKLERVKEAIEALDNASAVSVWNEYCNEAGYMDNYIYSMEEFDEIMSGSSPWEVARACYYSGNFCPAHDYFWFNGYANCESSDFPALDKESPFYVDDLAEWIVDNDNPLYNDDIREALEDEDEDED